ncbi:hypothetical protein BpHYR1_000614 [Brachionus plicatilis]|uniref:Reverse transcriptase domain-containing protein n=1 Tax=Brachionus plicatilis TaxID=10195 RepID=A0A3M7R5W1_BRAPC|nr:hypothetical protein BpHYR1_000614 [Brachionus plicatilis]
MYIPFILLSSPNIVNAEHFLKEIMQRYIFEFNILNLGASINGTNLSVIGYCDDLVIQAPSFSHYQTLLDKYSKYAQRWNIDFNPSKSAALVSQKGKAIMMRNFTFNGFEILQT